MRNIWLVATREFRERVRSRGFLLSSIAVPLFIIVAWVATGVFDPGGDPGGEETLPASPPETVTAYLDQAGLIRSIPAPLSEDLFRAFPDPESANRALESGEIGFYYWIPPDYLETGTVRRVSQQLPGGAPDAGLFTYVLAGNLLPEAGPEELARLRDPLGPTGPQFVSIVEGEAAGAGGFSFMPFLVTFVIIMPLFVSGGYLLQSLAQEKSSRVMEILLVSLQPRQLLAGKLLGLGALTLVQYAFWFIIVFAALAFTGQDPTQMLAGVNISPQEGLFAILFALGGYTLYAGFMAGLGALSPNLESGRSWVLLVSLPMMIPIYLWMAIVEAPDGPLAVALSLIPLTAPVAMLMRMTSAAVPFWQTALSLAILALAGAGILWLMARLFRVQTLLSGEAISLRRFWTAITTGYS